MTLFNKLDCQLREIAERNGTKKFTSDNVCNNVFKILSEMIISGITKEELELNLPYFQIMMDERPQSTEEFFEKQGELGQRILDRIRPLGCQRYPVDESRFQLWFIGGISFDKSPKNIQRIKKILVDIVMT